MASASANTLTIKGPATEETIRTAVEGIGYTFKGKVWSSHLRFVIIISDEQGDTYESQNKFDGDNKDVYHNGWFLS